MLFRSVDITSIQSKYFQSRFNIYGNHKDAKSVLNNDFLKNIEFIAKELNIKNIYFSYQENKIYLGFDFKDRSLFDASTIRSVYTDSDIMYFIRFYKAVEDLIESIKD